MKISIYSFAITALSSLIMTSAASAETSSVGNREQVMSLFQTCQTDWAQYSRRLNDMYGVVDRTISQMEQHEYDKAALARDPVVMLAQLTWPQLLKEKDESSSFYKECADYHFELRSTFDKNGKAKKSAFQGFSDCIAFNYRSDRNTEPLRSMLACYKYHAR